jgi:UDP-GlcNAc:undecaprenyl-phosphate GlcNAc-1-phosphate transferase
VVWIVGIVNSINLIDGLDGLAGGVIFFASIVNFIASIAFKATISSFLMASIGGSILGFLIYNWFPAKIYLGDGGAYALGFLLAISALIAPLQKATTAVAILVPILAFGLPICDTAITLLRRWLSGKNILSPDRGHLHHLFLDAGISHRQVVIGMYCMSAFSGSIGVAITLKRNPIIGCFLVVLTGFAVAWWGFKMKSYLIRLYKNKLR